MITASIPGPRGPTEIPCRLDSESATLSKRLGRAPTATELAVALGMDRNEVIDILVMGSLCRTPTNDGASVDQHVPGNTGKPVEWGGTPDRIGHHEALRPLLAALPDRERTVVVLRFFESLTQTQIAERVGMSPAHVAWLLAKALTQLRGQRQGLAGATVVAGPCSPG